MDNHYQSEELSINLVSLLFYVLKQWKKILIFFIIGAIIGCGISFVKMNRYSSPENIEKYLNSLEKEDINKDDIRLYTDYKALYEAALERGDSSVVLNMDQNNVYSASLRYYLHCNQDCADTLVAYFNSLLARDDNYENIEKASGLNCSLNDIKDLVGVSSSKVSLDSQIIIDGGGVLSNRDLYVNASATAPNENSLNAMFGAIKEILNSAFDEVLAAHPEVEIEKLYENTSYGYSSSIASRQSSYVKERQATLKELTTAGKDLSDDEKLYYSFYYNQDEFLEDLNVGFGKKAPAIGAVLGAIVAACYFAVVFIFDKHIKAEDEINTDFGLQILGSIDDRTAPKNAIDKWLLSLEEASLLKANSKEYVASVLEKCTGGGVALTYDSEDEHLESLAKELVGLGKNIVAAGDVLCCNEALGNIKDCAVIVPLVHLNKTTKLHLNRTLEFSRKFEKEIAGAVVIR